MKGSPRTQEASSLAGKWKNRHWEAVPRTGAHRTSIPPPSSKLLGVCNEKKTDFSNRGTVVERQEDTIVRNANENNLVFLSSTTSCTVSWHAGCNLVTVHQTETSPFPLQVMLACKHFHAAWDTITVNWRGADILWNWASVPQPSSQDHYFRDCRDTKIKSVLIIWTLNRSPAILCALSCVAWLHFQSHIQ